MRIKKLRNNWSSFFGTNEEKGFISPTYDFLSTEKKYVMKRWKEVIKSAESGNINQSEIDNVMERMQKTDQMILDEEKDQANLALTYPERKRIDFRFLLTPEFWDR